MEQINPADTDTRDQGKPNTLVPVYSAITVLVIVFIILDVYACSPPAGFRLHGKPMIRIVNEDAAIFAILGALAWWLIAQLSQKPLFERWFRTEIEQIDRLRKRRVLNDDQANYVTNTLREVTRVQGNFIRVRDRYTWTKAITVGGAAITACSAGLTTYGHHSLRLLTVLASLVTVVAGSLRTEYATDVAEWGHHRTWSVKYQAIIREYLNLTGEYRSFSNQGDGFKRFVDQIEKARQQEVAEFFQLLSVKPAPLQLDSSQATCGDGSGKPTDKA